MHATAWDTAAGATPSVWLHLLARAPPNANHAHPACGIVLQLLIATCPTHLSTPHAILCYRVCVTWSDWLPPACAQQVSRTAGPEHQQGEVLGCRIGVLPGCPCGSQGPSGWLAAWPALTLRDKSNLFLVLAIMAEVRHRNRAAAATGADALLACHTACPYARSFLGFARQAGEVLVGCLCGCYASSPWRRQHSALVNTQPNPGFLTASPQLWWSLLLLAASEITRPGWVPHLLHLLVGQGWSAALAVPYPPPPLG